MLASFLAAPAALAQATDWKQIKTPPLPPFHPQTPKRMVLPNGMVLLLQEDHELPLVNGMMRIRGGARVEPAGKAGLVDIYGDVWRTGGTRNRTGDQLDDFLEARAAKVETDGASDSTFINFSCLKNDLPDVFNVFVELLREPAFRQDKIELAKQQLNTSIARRNDDIGDIAARVSAQLAYGPNSPYARFPEYATVAAVTRDDLVAWHQKYVHPNNIILGIVGDFDSAAMELRVRQAFAAWPRGPEAEKPKIEIQPARPQVYFVPKEDVNQSDIQMVAQGIERNNPDYFAVTVMNEAFGGGFSSRLVKVLRTEKGLAYAVGGGIGSAFDHPGVFRLAMGTKSATTAEAVEGLRQQLEELIKNPPSEEELKFAKDAILNSFVFNFDSRDKVLREQMAYEFYGYPLDFLERFRAGIEKVTPEDVARVARQYVHPEQFATLVVGNPAEIGQQLAALGPVAKWDITIPPPPGEKQAAVEASDAAGKALIAKVVAALGGESKLQSVQAVEQKVALVRKTPQGDLPLDLDGITVFPDRQWTRIESPMGSMSMVYSPQASFMEMAGAARDLPATQKEDAQQSLKRDLLNVARHANDPKFLFSAGGTEKIGDVEAQVLNLNADGATARWYIDPQTGRVLRSAAQRTGSAGPVEQRVDYSDWKPVDGLVLPFKRTITEDGQQVGTADVKEIRINPPVDPKLFEKPAQPAAAPK